jgi:hypothetical protein
MKLLLVFAQAFLPLQIFLFRREAKEGKTALGFHGESNCSHRFSGIQVAGARIALPMLGGPRNDLMIGIADKRSVFGRPACVASNEFPAFLHESIRPTTGNPHPLQS